MALRQFATKCKPFWSYLPAIKAERLLPVSNGAARRIDSVPEIVSLSSFKELKAADFGAFDYRKNASSGGSTGFIDLFTNNVHKKLYMPTNMANTLKVYQDINISPILIEENVNKVKIIDPPTSESIVKKEAVRMILIRRRKMRKHKLRKLRKRMKFVFQKIKRKRELRKEQDFRTELLSQVEAADKFDAKAYVEGVLQTIRYHPKPETIEEIKERYRLLKKMNKYNTTFIRPKFDD